MNHIRHVIFAAILLLIFAHGASAQWVTATVQPESVIKGDRAFVVVILDDGKGGKARRELDLPVGSASTSSLTALLREENSVVTAKTSVPASGTVISLAAPPPVIPPTPTAKQVWLGKRDKLFRLKAVLDSGITAVQQEVALLQADINKSYVAGYVD